MSWFMTFVILAKLFALVSMISSYYASNDIIFIGSIIMYFIIELVQFNEVENE